MKNKLYFFIFLITSSMIPASTENLIPEKLSDYAVINNYISTTIAPVLSSISSASIPNVLLSNPYTAPISCFIACAWLHPTLFYSCINSPKMRPLSLPDKMQPEDLITKTSAVIQFLHHAKSIEAQNVEIDKTNTAWETSLCNRTVNTMQTRFLSAAAGCSGLATLANIAGFKDIYRLMMLGTTLSFGASTLCTGQRYMRYVDTKHKQNMEKINFDQVWNNTHRDTINGINRLSTDHEATIQKLPDMMQVNAQIADLDKTLHKNILIAQQTAAAAKTKMLDKLAPKPEPRLFGSLFNPIAPAENNIHRAERRAHTPTVLEQVATIAELGNNFISDNVRPETTANIYATMANVINPIATRLGSSNTYKASQVYTHKIEFEQQIKDEFKDAALTNIDLQEKIALLQASEKQTDSRNRHKKTIQKTRAQVHRDALPEFNRQFKTLNHDQSLIPYIHDIDKAVAAAQHPDGPAYPWNWSWQENKGN